jgi:hypothetical protein
VRVVSWFAVVRIGEGCRGVGALSSQLGNGRTLWREHRELRRCAGPQEIKEWFPEVLSGFAALGVPVLWKCGSENALISPVPHCTKPSNARSQM